MPLNLPPDAEERQIRYLGSAAIDGAPIAYIVVLAAVTTALAFIPVSFVLGSGGGGIPLSSGIFPLLGWLLGPIAGGVSSCIGTVIGVFLAPYTAGIPAASMWGSALASFAAGAMVLTPNRRLWWLWLTLFGLISLLLLTNRAIFQNGVTPSTVFLGTFIDWSALLLFALPTRTLCVRWIGSQNIRWVAVGLFLGTWIASGLAHLNLMAITYFIFNWPQEVWLALIPLIPFEHLIRCVTGTVIGTGVISGLRAIELVKPREAIY